MSGANEKPPEVFISYGSADKAIAEEICAGIESAGLACWIAPRNIDPGSTWTGSIVSAIGQCRVMALIFSSKSNESAHVQREILHAVELKSQVLPIRIEPVIPTGGLAYCLVGVQWYDATSRPVSQHIAPIAGQLRLMLERAGTTPVAPGEPAQVTGAAEHAPDIYFQCATCEQRLVTEAHAAGQTGECPNCGTPFTVPWRRAHAPTAESGNGGHSSGEIGSPGRRQFRSRGDRGDQDHAGHVPGAAGQGAGRPGGAQGRESHRAIESPRGRTGLGRGSGAVRADRDGGGQPPAARDVGDGVSVLIFHTSFAPPGRDRFFMAGPVVPLRSTTG